MTLIAGIGFTSPWLLLGLLVLPLLWLLLRAIPPAPKRQPFPAVTLLLGLRDDESLSDRTPWWLLLLRMLAVAAAIIGLSGPVLNPAQDYGGRGPLLIVLDSSWAGAPRWDQNRTQIEAELSEAGRAGRPVALLRLTAPEPLQFLSAPQWTRQLAGMPPHPWTPGPAQLAQAQTMIAATEGGFDTLWLSDGLAMEGRADLVAALSDHGEIEVYESATPTLGLLPATYDDGAIVLRAQRSTSGLPQDITVQAVGPDPAGVERALAAATLAFDANSTHAEGRLTLPMELRARISRFEILNSRSAGAVSLTDDRLRRREVALISAQSSNEGLALLSPLHYLRQALIPSTELLEGALTDLLPANPDVVILADVARLAPDQEAALVDWVEQGGLLLRFAGPRLAASDTARDTEEPLMPVRLRIGGRSIGGAMSWGEPKSLAPFAEGTPFYGLEIPDEVTIGSQVMAQPDPELANRVVAELNDGTPLVTRKALGQGQVILFHVTANAEWSTLPLSGLFVEMLERLAISSVAKPPEAEDLDGTTWQATAVLDGFGRLVDADSLAGVAGPELIAGAAGPELQPGLYTSGKRAYARNVLRDGDELLPARWPASVPVQLYEAAKERPLAGALIGLALLLMAVDVVAALLVSGLWSPARVAGLALACALGLILGVAPQSGQAQSTRTATDLTANLTLAFVKTGQADADRIAEEGLRGLGNVLSLRTSVEPAAPYGVDLETDELSFFPFLYWPVTDAQPMPSSDAYARLNDYLRTGGMILFDTRDADLAQAGATSSAARRLQQLALPLDIPPLEPMPADHVLTRAFYLLQDFPGRFPRGQIWVEAAPPDAEQVEGLPFRNLNDGVTPVVIGGNDWAAAWAVDADNVPLYPVGRGFSGERQRELARRFGVNLLMHVLTGNYKSDQVHVPALLDRLGQ
ncbi:MAG: LytTR family transcriptional regulator [Alphaproteobacteria bacterium MedPE-SWcel]|nr:MAG: LytTR family transcriptional regulator [Alphaproteobacteria bacterium MedPE-SWcel]